MRFSWLINRIFSGKAEKVSDDLFRETLSKKYSETPASIVQIGVCDGVINDPIYDIIKNKILTKTVVLIEPQAQLHEVIAQNYSYHSDPRIVNCAIGPEGDIVLYRLAERFHNVLEKSYLKDAPSYRVPAGFVSTNRDHVVDHMRGKLPKSIRAEDAIEEVIVKSKTLTSVLDDIEVDHFDVLQVDCEGMDDVVLYNCQIERYRPSVINFEYMHLPECRKIKVVKFLKDLGYTVIEYSKSDMLATI